MCEQMHSSIYRNLLESISKNILIFILATYAEERYPTRPGAGARSSSKAVRPR